MRRRERERRRCYDYAAMLTWIAIFIGAGCGGVLRFALGGFVQAWAGPGFPLGTLVVNVSGCFAMGLLGTAMTGPPMVREEVRAAVFVGLLGGYTTFSTFGRETQQLAAAGDWLRAGVYVLASVTLSLAAVWLGAAAAGRLWGPVGR